MFFRKKNQPDPRRARQASLSGGLGTRPVFSYHAQTARNDSYAGRRSIRLPWATPEAAKSTPRRLSNRHWPKRVVVVAMLILVAALGLDSLFLTRDPVIVVQGQPDGQQLLLQSQNVYQQAARAVLASSLANTNKLTINTGKIAQELEKQFPELSRVSLVLPVVGRRPVLHIQTARPVLLLASGRVGGVFLVDESGRAVMDAAKVADAVKQHLPVVQDQTGLSVTVGGSALPSGNIGFITEMIGQFGSKGIQISSMVLPPGASELDIRIEGAAYSIKCNLRGDARVEAGAFLAVKQQLERENKTPGSYVDVRVDNKAYYR